MFVAINITLPRLGATRGAEAFFTEGYASFFQRRDRFDGHAASFIFNVAAVAAVASFSAGEGVGVGYGAGTRLIATREGNETH